MIEEPSTPENMAQLPITALQLSPRTLNCLHRAGLKTVGEIVAADPEQLIKIRNFGQKALAEVFEAIPQLRTTFREASSDGRLFSEQQQLACDKQRALIDVDETKAINLLNSIGPISKSLLQELNLIREFDILKRRFGLERSKIYTLQDIGEFYDLTRERVRQLEGRAIKKIQGALLGNIRGKAWYLPDIIIAEAKALEVALRQQGTALIEKDIMQLFEARYVITITQKDIANVHFLMTILGGSGSSLTGAGLVVMIDEQPDARLMQ